jgi:hypothetical protein
LITPNARSITLRRDECQKLNISYFLERCKVSNFVWITRVH